MVKVSIIIPAYNALRFLPETLVSVFAQTFTDFELFVVDDGSTDGTDHWVEEQQDPRIRLLRQPNAGPAAARNNGIRTSQGSYIAFLDADDLWEPGKLEIQVQLLNAHPEVGLVYVGAQTIDSMGIPTGTQIRPRLSGHVWEDLLVMNNICSPSAVMVRRSVLEEVGLFDEDRRIQTAEDWELWIRIARNQILMNIQETLLSYRVHPGSGSSDLMQLCNSCTAVIEKTFHNVPDQLQYLKAMSYEHLYWTRAWDFALRSEPYKAEDFLRRAVACRPHLRTEKQYRYLVISLRILKLFGKPGLNYFYRLLALVSRNPSQKM